MPRVSLISFRSTAICLLIYRKWCLILNIWIAVYSDAFYGRETVNNPSVRPSVRLSICLSFSLSLSFLCFLCLSLFLSVCLSVCLSVSLVRSFYLSYTTHGVNKCKLICMYCTSAFCPTVLHLPNFEGCVSINEWGMWLQCMLILKAPKDNLSAVCHMLTV